MINAPSKNISIAKDNLIFILSLFVLLFWSGGNFLNVYHVQIVVVFFEMLWMPVTVLSIALPVVSLIFWIKEKFKLKSFYFYSLLVFTTLIIMLAKYGN